MVAMKELSDQTKLSVRSHPDIFAVIHGLEAAFGRGKGITFRGKRLTKEAIVNALLAYVGSLGDEEKWFVLAEGAARAELVLVETEEERRAVEDRLKEIDRLGQPRHVATREETEADLRRRQEQARPPRKGKGKKSREGDCDNEGTEGRGLPKLAR